MSRTRVVTGCYYVGLTVLLLLIVTRTLGDLLPGAIAGKVGENSEGFLLALLLPLWVQAVRPRLAGTAEVVVTLAAAAVALAVGVWLYRTTTVTSTVKTLNETFLALAVLLPYVQRRRPLPPVVGPAAAGAVLALMVLGGRLALVTRLAETLVMLLLVPLALDVVDRGVLEPGARTSPRLRWGWYAALLLAPVVIAGLHRAGLPGALDSAVAYGARAQEAFVGVLVLSLYLAVGLGRTGRVDEPVHPQPAPTA